ncbi:hypothetical protein OPV22_023443 [Ensete ventricosum]|uniref:Uncharacterized protein n=1 Tax=Ensete ventricosum TaxID=4639 RepID=A0AAV8PF90_ENSVE|nr:hypothetical protein OPV22_023443 [Ensete ventricosum]
MEAECKSVHDPFYCHHQRGNCSGHFMSMKPEMIGAKAEDRRVRPAVRRIMEHGAEFADGTVEEFDVAYTSLISVLNDKDYYSVSEINVHAFACLLIAKPMSSGT